MIISVINHTNGQLSDEQVQGAIRATAGATIFLGAPTKERRSGPSASIPEDTSASSIPRRGITRLSQGRATKRPQNA